MRFLVIIFSAFFLLSLNFQPALAQGGGIFGGGGFGGIFRGIQKNLQDLFGGGKAPSLGGARLPSGPSAPIPTPDPANPPPLPNAADAVKVWLEWDALSVGPEGVKAGPNDPFWQDPNQLGRTHEQIIREEGCDCQPEPIFGEGCLYQEGSAKHVLYGWCGNEPNFIDPSVLNCPPNTDTCIPLCDVGRDAKGRCIPTKTPGPNSDTLPFAISNKYSRRDGYTYRCIPEPCVARCPFTENYIEFQTQVYHSNEIELEAVVENLSSHEVKNVQVEINNLTYQTNKKDEYGLPHNLDYPVESISTDWPPIVRYEHGSNLTSGQTISTGGDAPLQIDQPITIGPFDLAATNDPAGKDQKRFPLQMPQALRRAIPSSEEDPNTCEGGAPQPIPTPTGLPVPQPPGQTDPLPCECRAVYTHSKPSNPFPPPIDGWGCPNWANHPADKKGPVPLDQLPPNEVIDICRLYYGIPGGKYQVIGDENGKTCDRDCIAVPGCPPPWCYQGSSCSNTDYSACPNGQPISTSTQAPNKLSELLSKVESLIPPQPAQAYGCGVVCIEEPRTGYKSQGGIALRDYEDLSNYSTNASCKLREFKDVTEFGGCGYEASSNNSIIGPIQIEVKYGQTQSSRSMLLASLPVGGQIIDDEARPFGWPASGKVKQDWGNTSQAQTEGDFRSEPNELYTDYLLCTGEGATYPEGRARTGDWLHPGIDIEPLTAEEAETSVYSTQAGFITFAGDAGSITGSSGASVPARVESGTTVQIEADTNQDNLPDAATRYSHLEPGSLQFDVRWKALPRGESSTPYPFGAGPYVARNQLLGLMGDSGSPGERKVRYDILYNQFPSADPTFWNCTSDPYILACLSDEIQRFFFSRSKFESETVSAPVYKNP